MMKNNRSRKDQTDSVDAEVPLMKTERERLNTSSSSAKTKKQTSYTIKPEKNEFIQKLMETFLTKLSESISQQTELQSEKKSEINNQLQEVKEAAEKLKNQLESKNQQTIKPETNEFIKKLMETFLTLDSKLSESISQQTELCETIRQAQEEKQKMERLNNELYSTKQQLENKLKDEEKRNEETNKKVKQLQSEKKTEIIKQLQQLKQTTAKLKDWLEKNSHEMIKSEMELDKYIQKVLQKFPTLESKWWQNTDISQKLPDVKQAAEHLKAELEFRSREINSEKEKDEIIQKLMKTFPTLDSKWKKNTDIIKQLVQVKQRAEGLKKQLQAKTHESEEKTETIHQLQQLKQAAETLKIQLESKNQQMIKSEREKNEIIQKLMETFPTLGSKWKENTDIIYQLQEVKETAEKLKQLEKKHLELQGETDSDIIKQLQQVKDKAENLKHQMESINWQMLQAEKTRNEETDRKLKELVKQLEEKKNKTEETLNELQLSGNISQAQEEKQKMEREIKRLRNELESTKQQLQQEKQAAENLKKQLEDKNHESSKPQKSDFILDEVHKYGPYICLRNTSSEVKLMTGWELKQQINDRNPVTYKFQENFTLKAGEGLTLHRFSTTRGPYPDNTHLMWKDMNNWYSGDNVKISLISSTGEEHRLQ